MNSELRALLSVKIPTLTSLPQLAQATTFPPEPSPRSVRRVSSAQSTATSYDRHTAASLWRCGGSGHFDRNDDPEGALAASPRLPEAKIAALTERLHNSASRLGKLDSGNGARDRQRQSPTVAPLPNSVFAARFHDRPQQQHMEWAARTSQQQDAANRAMHAVVCGAHVRSARETDDLVARLCNPALHDAELQSCRTKYLDRKQREGEAFRQARAALRRERNHSKLNKK